MKLADFPMFASILSTLPDYTDREGKVKNPGARAARRVERTELALTYLSEGLAAGEIANQRFTEAKQIINRSLEEAWGERDRSISVYNRNAPAGVEKFFMNFLYPQAHLAAGHIKKLEKLPQDDPAVMALLPLLREVAPITDAVQTLKDKVVKRQPKTEDQKRAERYTAPRSSTKAVADVQGKLEGIVAEHYEAILSAFKSQYNRVLDGFLAAQKAADADRTLNQPLNIRHGQDLNVRNGRLTDYQSYYSPHWHCMVREGRNKGQTNGNLQTLLLVLKGERQGDGSYRFVLDPDAREILAEEAKKMAEMIRNEFVFKNLRKIVSLLEGKGDALFGDIEIIDNDISLGGLTGSLRITFTDGAEFTAKNSVVWSTSVLGKDFARYPLTFHNVKLAGGVKMPSPSEKRMNTVFLGKEAA